MVQFGVDGGLPANVSAPFLSWLAANHRQLAKGGSLPRQQHHARWAYLYEDLLATKGLPRNGHD